MASGPQSNRPGFFARLFSRGNAGASNPGALMDLMFSEISTGNDIADLPRMETMRELINSLWYIYGADVEGDVVEFGTMSGFTASRIAKTMTWLENMIPMQRRLILADSFEGLPESTAKADVESPHVAKGVWSAGACKVLSRADLVALCSREFKAERIDVLEGWYKDTVPKLSADRKLALLHVDCDLYQSTMDALVPCFERGMVSEGAMIHFDDWNCTRASPDFGERRAWAELVERYDIAASHCGDYSWHGHKLIVHSYNGMHKSG
jgi:O-methyltransferase